MKLLLDTHAFLWFVWKDRRLSPTAQALIEDAENEPLISLVSCWEIAIKVRIGKLQLAEPVDEFLTREIPGNRMQLLPITLPHAALVSVLPLAKHADPFDRLLIAQAIFEDHPIISNEALFDAYPVTRIW